MTTPFLTLRTESIGHGLGGLVYWNSKRCPRERMREACARAACERFVPAVPPQSTALRDCVLECARVHFGRKRRQPIIVRELQDHGSFQAVRVVPGATENQYQHLFSARYSNPEQWQVRLVGTSGLYDLETALQRAVLDARDYLPSAVVSQIMVRMLRKWEATLLKDDGGLWFLPGVHLHEYRVVAEWLMGFGPRFHVTQFEVASDPSTVDHVLSKLRVEVTEGIDEIMQDVLTAEGGMQDRSIRIRQAKADAFLAKVRNYESFTSRTLSDLTEAIGRAQQALAVNKLLSAAV